MHNVTVILPDADETTEGVLHLPGSPVRCGDADCSLCGFPVREFPNMDGMGDKHSPPRDPAEGNHDGILATPTAQAGMTEWMHLRCVLDCAEQHGSLGLHVGAYLPESGRHAAGVGS